MPAQADGTRDKQQAKVFMHDNKHWAVLAKTGGTYLWRLDGTTWTQILLLATQNLRSDAIVEGNLVHILMYGGSPTTTPPNISKFIILDYVAATSTYQPWQQNPNVVNIQLDMDVETASLPKDGTGRL